MTAQLLSMPPGLHEFGAADNHSRNQTICHSNGMPTMEKQQAMSASPQQEEASRGRRRTRGSENGDDDGHDDQEDGGSGSSKKRRRSRKGLDKKFECPHDGCGKSYSRAEHLYRHQLNRVEQYLDIRDKPTQLCQKGSEHAHWMNYVEYSELCISCLRIPAIEKTAFDNPKQIYNCDFPDCHRSFVRQDLCARHKERHTARGSQLLRKENFMQNLNPIVTAAMQAQSAKLSKQHQHASPTVRPGDAAFSAPTSYPGGHPPAFGGTERNFVMQSPASVGASSATLRSENSTPHDGHLQSPHNSIERSKTDDGYRSNDMAGPPPRSATFTAQNAPYGQSGGQRFGNDGFVKPGPVHGYTSSSPYTGATPTQPFHRGEHPSQSPGPYPGQQNFPPLTALPQPAYPIMSQSPVGAEGHTHYPASSAASTMAQVSDGALIEGMTPTYAMPMFGGEGYSRSPFAMADDFAAWLFNDQNFGPGASPMAGYAGPGAPPHGAGNANFSLQAPYFTHDPLVNGFFSQPVPPQHPMAVNNLIDTNMQQLALSEERRQEILDLIDSRFDDTSHAPGKKREELLDGHRDDENHLLSLQMMQTYIASYWLHFHPQMPILHKPTFAANTCPKLLLIAMIALGASCLEKSHGYEVTQSCSELSHFLAWHLRWEIFMDADFRPPAKLWIFQALLLLEIFEKMYSTRPLHERAHIHHATTLTLMRRGSSLIGRSSIDSPPSGSERDGSRHGSLNGAVNNSGQFTPDEWWNQWIINEATRRAAFAAFVMDSIHATMFGHSAVMVAHEMRLPLPCDEALWNATSSAEVGRVEQSLHSNNIKQANFLDGLKKTLNGQPVRTNSFGRTILMAGLLSVSWHMNQRDLQVSSLGVSQALGGRDKWRGSLTRAFDFWKMDLDESFAKAGVEQTPSSFYQTTRADDENVFESRTVLHHLAHMAMHVDIVDCQIFAGASRLLGRSITPQDYNGAQRRMKEGWAPTARARDATFYALRFLSQVLIPDDNNSMAKPEFGYSARDDFLLNRPWVLYFATLIVWSYGFALDGPIKPMYQLNSDEEVVNDMQGFLRRVGGVRAPDDLAKMTNRNACLGLLTLMKDTFSKTRWELLHEASKLLTKCIEMLSTGAPTT
ncbi:hypothetical protein EJ08DRAFT_660339 [Tothia fuscella]|uniref:C2H2-type domain-containing protein n=1 Tax=Tothia fuscella TaxID=1048955 RepID=A0A9P4NTB1_9PEZI|nr:hypothetical protein EJ08DRAFT_660339 [Tothia fuscella]